MAVKFTSVKCPECGANLPIEEGRERMFCSFCGTQIIMTNKNEHTYRHVDEAEVKRAETEQLIHLKELELEEKENERNRKGRRIAFSIAGALAVFGAFSEIAIPYNLLGIFAIVILDGSLSLRLFQKMTRKRKKRGVLYPHMKFKLPRTCAIPKAKTIIAWQLSSVLPVSATFKPSH